MGHISFVAFLFLVGHPFVVVTLGPLPVPSSFDKPTNHFSVSATSTYGSNKRRMIKKDVAMTKATGSSRTHPCITIKFYCIELRGDVIDS